MAKQRKWTGGETQFLFDNYKLLTYREIAITLARTLFSVQRKARTLNIKKYGWSSSSDRFLKTRFKELTYQELATALGRKRRSVITRCQKLGLSGNAWYKARRGEKHGMWKGGKRLTSDGYVIYKAGALRGQHEHRAVMEQALGRPLSPGELVHHIDGNKTNNDLDNLQILTQAEHNRIHNWAWLYRNSP